MVAAGVDRRRRPTCQRRREWEGGRRGGKGIVVTVKVRRKTIYSNFLAQMAMGCDGRSDDDLDAILP